MSIMTKDDFYRGKRVIKTEWWLNWCGFPSLRWARLRVFNDGTADSCFEPNDTLFGFDSRAYASFILSEDEYLSFDNMDHEDELEHGVCLALMVPPEWPESVNQPFEYLGTY